MSNFPTYPQTPYVIELTHDVTNPEPDRRSPRDWTKMPVLKAGRRFIVKQTIDGWSSISSPEHGYHYVAAHSPLGGKMMAAAYRVPPQTVSELAVVTGCDYGPGLILEYLLKLGKVTRADFEAVAAAIDAEEANGEQP